jgi:restriction system protein
MAKGVGSGGADSERPASHQQVDEPEPEVPSLTLRDRFLQIESKWQIFCNDYITLEWPFGGLHLRGCTDCDGRQFSHVRPCVNCGAITISLDLVAVASDTNKSSQMAVDSFRRAKKTRVRFGILIWTLAILFIIVCLLVNCWLGVLISVVVVPLGAGAHVGILSAIRGLFRRRYPKEKMPSKANSPKTAEKLERFCDDVVHPFFARNGIVEGQPVHVPLQEVSLLVSLFEKEGLGENEPYDWNDFLTACALRRDFLLFRQRIEYFENADPITVYTSLLPNEASDRLSLPFLRQILADRGRDMDVEALIQLVEDRRHQFRLTAFSKDLALRRQGESMNIVISQVDDMNPYNFESLLGMVYETQGYRIEVTRKSGDQGADVIMEKAGIRAVVQAKLYAQPVGNSAVQEVFAAKTHYKCQEAIVVTNNSFTRSAIELAMTNSVKLVDRPKLIEMLNEFNKHPKDYGRLSSLMVPTLPPSEPIPKVVPVKETAV